MSGTLTWIGDGVALAYETDLGTQERPAGYPPHGGHGGSAAQGGGAGAWDWDCGWGVEVIPLQYSAFRLVVGPTQSLSREVSMTPVVPEPLTILTCGLALTALGRYTRKRMRRRKK